MVRKFVPTVLSILMALAAAVPSFAQTGPTGGGQTGTIGGTQPAPLAVIGIGEADLLNCLRGLDPNVKVTPIKDGTSYTLTVRRDGWQYDLRVFSYAGCVWVDTLLGNPIANVQSLPAQHLAQLLKLTYDIGPSHFSLIQLNDGRMRLCLARMLERGPLTGAGLRNQIDFFCKQIRDTYPAWNAILAAAK
jgi:hypothetical protein